jgi:hypothetical protein
MTVLIGRAHNYTRAKSTSGMRPRSRVSQQFHILCLNRRFGAELDADERREQPAPQRCWLARSRCSQAGDRSVMDGYDLTAEE